ncbi:hypothetical protein BN7_1330 [Wickerhamomyces ciferrii]|uniref:RING-type E3 ubiquitin transferase n=1 Tax=Wickerhamomyces ciferrii (strain ATCC 14091 / BCRC 22168 / CBS 111 / JCM 3599 / NBRC 0793 / NRRL Y-1031 F-60-10) TaxID=1206466 RepID=K0KFW0_WICCF|nr:uncharacterized protein BN7_1330 [Wickerhamomyces ciferrii]CCH41791.1 hypothetical protein BN7_1330 [Wickerhamomyces ciferrii]
MYSASQPTLERPERLERPSLSYGNSYNGNNQNQPQSSSTVQQVGQPLPQPIPQQQHPGSQGTPPPNRRRGSSLGNFTSNLFSNITSSLRNNSSSNLNSNGQNRSRASSTSRSNYQSNNNSHSQVNIQRGNSAGNVPLYSQSHTPSNLNHEHSTSTPQSANNITMEGATHYFDNSALATTPIEDSRLLQGQTRANSLAIQQNKQDPDGTYSIRLTPFIDHSSSSTGLYFSPVLRKTKPGSKLSLGRYTDKVREAAQAPPGSDLPVVFKSKVVSRTHAEFIVDYEGNWFIRDLKSSSGTFLNHIRLSPASVESAITPINNGDVLQLGMDFRGGVEDIFKCVKMRVEMNKSWQRKANQFNKEAHERLRTLALNNNSTELSECAICLLKVKPCQAVFISPCSHCWHYKCIRPIVVKSYPQFLCPNCRETCDLEADLDEDEESSESEDESMNNASQDDLNNGPTNVGSNKNQNKSNSSGSAEDLILEEELSNEE